MPLRWILFFAGITAALSAQTPNISGDYSGVLGPLHVKLHVKTIGAGKLTCTLDSPDQGANGLGCANVQLEEKTLSFEVPSVGGKWKGTVSADGATLNGNWSQGTEIPLVFTRDEPFLAAEKPSRVDGVWLGAIEVNGAKLRLQVLVKSDRSGKEYCSADSLDQGAMGLACDNVHFQDNHFSFEVPQVHGHWTGTLSDSGNELNGTWSQGADLPLNFTREATILEAIRPEPPKYEAAMPAVAIDELKAVLDRDLAPALKHGTLAPETNGGVAIGVLQHGKRKFFVYGPVQENSIFEIGSISKTFTGLILAQMVEQHKVKFDDPVRELLPPGTVAKPAGPEITLLDLATQHSGLPRMPDNFHPANPNDPYADYAPANLYEFIRKKGVQKPEHAGFLYSNLGVGLLGQALVDRASMSYPQLLKFEVTGPLNMNETVVKLSPEQEKRFATGHTAQHQPTSPWNLDALAGAGAIRSTANDMLTYLEAQLHPDSIQHAAGEPGATISGAIKLTHELHGDALPEMQIALAWFYNKKTGSYWHNGATGGYSSFAFFNPAEDTAAVVLFNTSINPGGSFADRLGEHIAERLSGHPAIVLDGVP